MFWKNKANVHGIAKSDNITAIEYTSESGRSSRRLIVYDESVDKVYHECLATGKGNPCWHLGGMAHVMSWGLPKNVSVESAIPFSLDIKWEDVTRRHMADKDGHFRILNVMGATDTDRPVEPEFAHPEPEIPPEPPSEPVKSTRPPKSTKKDHPSVELPPELAWLGHYHIPKKIMDRVLAFRKVQEERLTPEQKAKVPEARYIASGIEVASALSALLCQEGVWVPALLAGPKGSGKSTFAETLAAILHLPVVKVFGGVDINLDALLGGKTLEPVDNNIDPVTDARLRAAAKAAGVEVENILNKLRGSQLKVVYEPGLLLNAVQNGEMVVFDEINMVNAEITSLMHGLLDWQRTLSVPGLGSVDADPNFRLVACMNHGYVGVKQLNEAFQDRFRSISVPHLPEVELSKLFKECTKCDEGIADILACLFTKLSSRVANGDITERGVSVRAMIQAVNEYHDGVGTLRDTVVSCLTAGLGDKYEADQIRLTVESSIV
ncbi:AAA family ATPase [Pelotomaculum propionicicum]|uniref:AAA family ATPase n=1 Tax=Pelotomaculum propionicicum TaxID=258475 RepID=UPI003B7BA0B1